jgi:hypothetical protein
MSISLIPKNLNPVDSPIRDTIIGGAKVAIITGLVLGVIAASVVSGGAVPAALAFGAVLINSTWGIAGLSIIGIIAARNLQLITSVVIAKTHGADRAKADSSITDTMKRMAAAPLCTGAFVLGIGLTPLKLGYNLAKWGLKEIDPNQFAPNSTTKPKPPGFVTLCGSSNNNTGSSLNQYGELAKEYGRLIEKSTDNFPAITLTEAISEAIFFPTRLACATNEFIRPRNQDPSDSENSGSFDMNSFTDFFAETDTEPTDEIPAQTDLS